MFRNTVEFEVFGDYALFSDPITRVGGEKSSYPIPTYEAIKGILHSVYWKPTLIWIIDAIRVMKPIQTQTKGIRPIKMGGGNDLSYYTYLKDVRYQVRAHFVWNENRPELATDRNEYKHHNIAKRMIEKGGRRDVFLGTRECQGYVQPCVFGQGEGYYDKQEGQPDREISFGIVYHGISYPDERAPGAPEGQMVVRFWNAVMKNGIVEFPPPEACPIKRVVREGMSVKPFSKERNNFTGLDEFREVE